MKMIKKDAGGKSKVIDINLDLDELTKMVGGFIEIVQLRLYEPKFSKHQYVLIVNDEGRIRNMPLNFILPRTRTPIHGNVVALKLNVNGEFAGLNEFDINQLTNYMEESNYGIIKSQSLV